MASPVTTETLRSRLFVKNYDHDPGATTAIVVSPDGGTTLRTVDMSKYSHFLVQARPLIVGGAGLTKLEIIAAAASTMATPEVIKDSGTVAADAINDVVTEGCTRDEIAQVASTSGKKLRYVAGRLTMGTATDEANVTYIAKAITPGRNETPATDIT